MGNNFCGALICDNVNNSLLEGHEMSGRQQDEIEDDEAIYLKSPIMKPMQEINAN